MTLFQKRISQDFDFLIKEFGFKISCKGELSVSFSRNSSSISINYDIISHELWLDVFNGQRNIDINQIILFTNKENSFKSYLFQGTLEEVLNSGVQLLAKQCYEIVMPLIQDSNLFNEVIIHSNKMLSNILIEDKRRFAEKAFKERRFKDVIEIYSDIKDQLTGMDMQRLKIAEKKITGKK